MESKVDKAKVSDSRGICSNSAATCSNHNPRDSVKKRPLPQTEDEPAAPHAQQSSLNVTSKRRVFSGYATKSLLLNPQPSSLISVASSTSSGITSKSTSPLFSIALDAFSRKDYAKTCRFCTKIIASNPRIPDLRVLECRSLSWLGLGNGEKALEDAQLIIKLAETQSKGYLLAGKIHRACKSNEAAKKIYVSALQKVSPTDRKYVELQQYLAKLSQTPLGIENESDENIPMEPQVCSKEKIDTTSIYIFGDYHLPLELILFILQFLSVRDVCILSASSKIWRRILSMLPEFWIDIVLDVSVKKASNAGILALVNRAGGRLERLEVLNASQLSDPLLTKLSKIPNLFNFQSMSMCRNYRFTPMALSSFLVNLTALSKLNLAYTNADDTVLQTVFKHCVLKELVIDGCDLITNAAFTSRWKLKALQSLSMARCGISTSAVRACLSKKMKFLCLDVCSNVTADILPLLAGEPLTELNLSKIKFSIRGETRRALLDDAILEFCSSSGDAWALRKLDISSCALLSDSALDYLSVFFPRLEHVNFTGCVSLTDTGIGLFATQCTSLQCIILYSCQRVTDIGINTLLIQHAGSLRTLDLGNTRVTNALIPALCSSPVRLIDLSIRQTQITIRAAFQLANKAGQPLARLDISGCPGYDYRILADINRKMSGCRIVCGDI